jgi:hypothetical protein
MRLRASVALLICLLATTAAGCGSTHKGATSTPTTTAAPPTTTQAVVDPLARLTRCFEGQGYTVTPITPEALQTAPRRFQFIAVWDLLNPNARVAVSLAISKSIAGAKLGAAYTRKLNAKLGKGVVKAPVVRLGRFDVLWTAEPAGVDTASIYGCVRKAL